MCETEAAGLGAPLDSDCSIATRVASSGPGRPVSRPARSTAASTRSRCRAGWNRRLIYTFGGGCTGGWYRQGPSTGGVLDDFMLQPRLRGRVRRR